MSTVDKLLKKRRKEQKPSNNEEPEINNQPIKVQPEDTDPKKQSDYNKYIDSYHRNTPSAKFSHQILPSSVNVYNKTKIPMCCFANPVCLDNEPMQKSADKIPRCNHCRAYMNCYNTIMKKFYRCFLCGNLNADDDMHMQLRESNYQALGSQNVYLNAPPENSLIFLIDVSAASYACKMLYYAVIVIKEIFAREELNDAQIYFYTYDEAVHEYDFSGQQVKCTILDNNITEFGSRLLGSYLHEIRDKLFQLLDTLQQTAQNNPKTGSNFFGAFSYVYDSIKHTGGKIYIFQSNESFANETFCQQFIKPNPKSETNQQPPKKSVLQSNNKQFFNKFVSNMLNSSISCAIFIFAKTFKNIRVLTDCFKLTNSEILLYEKDSQQDLMKFYYELYYLLSTPYYFDVRMELIIVPGWYFTAVYGNLYRLKQFITFKYCHLQNSKKMCCCFLPQQTGGTPPYFAFQIVTNYRYQRQNYLSVNTLVVPISSSVQKIYEGIDYQVAAAGILKSNLSSLRIEQFLVVKNKFMKQVSNIWSCYMSAYNRNPSSQIKSMILCFLGFLKSAHMQIQSINNSIMLDRVIAQRNLLQSCNYLDIATFFSPYLFKISSMTDNMCRDDAEFIYPQIVQVKFADVKQGIYLMDSGVCIYLFIARQCSPSLIMDLFGKNQIPKNETLSEDSILTNSFLGSKLVTLVRVLRQQKTYGWIPMQIVRCGQNTFHQKMFYMNFFTEKYDEFRTFKLSLNEFIVTLEQQY